jgi:hypothetical protein
MTLKEWLASRYQSLPQEELSRLLTLIETVNSYFGKKLSREERRRILLPLAEELQEILGPDESVELETIMAATDGRPQERGH